jgi:hypothetical protein
MNSGRSEVAGGGDSGGIALGRERERECREREKRERERERGGRKAARRFMIGPVTPTSLA